MKHLNLGVRRALRLSVGALSLVAGALFAQGPADAAEACISQQARDALTACPGGKLGTTMGKKAQVSFKSAAPINLKKGDAQIKPTNPTAQMNAAQRDERRNRLAARSRQLLVTEIQGLESLFASTPKTAPDRPKLMRRLAEGYVELESAAFRDKTENSVKADEVKRKNPGQAQAFTDEAGKADKILNASRQFAIKYYTQLKNQYPKWCQNSNAQNPAQSTGCTDEVLYYLAYEYEQASNLVEARKVYLELIQGWPQSKFIPNAYLAFGELFFNEAQGDPSKWGSAEQAYNEVIKYPAPDNKVWGYAHYKLGYVYWNKGDFPRAMSEFKKTIDYGMQYTQLPNAEQLAISARRDIIPIYALAGDPKRAYDFFHPLSGDSGGANDKTFKMMDDLGQNYLDTGHYAEGIALYQDLMTRDKGPKSCLYQGHVAEATLAMKSGNKDQVMGELTKQVEVHKKFTSENQPADAKIKCGNITADLVAETAMAWHLEAVGSGGVRGTGDKKTMQLAAQLYEHLVKTFKQEDFAKFEFPRIVKEDWPNIFKVKYQMADLLYFQKDWAKCGPAFDAVVAEDPTGPTAPEAAYAAVLCYQNIYVETHKDGSDKKGTGNLPSSGTAKKDDKKKADLAKFIPKDFSENQKGMITAFNRYICYIKPPAGDKEANEQYVEVKYARGRTYFEAQHWEEAAVAFREVAMNHADKDVGIYASQLYLESLNILGSSIESPRPSCLIDDMNQDVPKLVDLYCKGGKEKENAEQCGILIRIQRDLERIRAEQLVKAADRGGKDASKQYEQAATSYLEMWKKYGESACESKQPACERSEEVLYNAARAFQAARLIAKSIAVRKILIDPRYHLDQTELAKKAVYEIGGNYQAIAVYDEAANWFEKYATASAKSEKAPDALLDATLLRLGLGQEDQAIKDADLFNRNFGAQKAALAAQVAFAIGAHYIEREDWGEARRRLANAMPQIDRNATVDVQIQAHAFLGRVLTKVNSVTAAAGEYGKVRSMWKDPAAAVKRMQDQGGDDRKLVKMLTAVGEALFFFAEQKRKEVDRIHFPEYKGIGTKEDVLKHVNTKVIDWLKKKRAAIEDTEKEYLKVVKIEPAPPPRWVIASGSRVGQLWGKFVAEFRAAPIPKEWKGHGVIPGTGDLTYDELRGEYYAKLDEASEPQKQQAKGAYKTCLDYSVKYQFFDEYSRKCEEWLSKNYGAEYHLIDEFRGSPNRMNSGLSDRATPLNLDGTPFRVEQPPPPDAAEDKAQGAADKKPEDEKPAKPGAAKASPFKGKPRKK